MLDAIVLYPCFQWKKLTLMRMVCLQTLGPITLTLLCIGHVRLPAKDLPYLLFVQGKSEEAFMSLASNYYRLWHIL